MKLIKYKNYLVSWLQEKVKDAGSKGVVVGLSGGVDSSVVAAIAKEAFPNNSIGVYLPIGNMGQDLIDAKLVAEKINIETKEINLTTTYEEIKKVMNVKNKLSNANIKPRLRMTALYAIAQENNYLVLGTDNAAEWILGYFTKYGDGGVDLLPIIHLLKSQVKELAKKLDLPKVVYTKKPTAALWEGQSDEEELGVSYDEVDAYIQGKKISDKSKKIIEHQIKSTQHKREKLPTPKPL